MILDAFTNLLTCMYYQFATYVINQKQSLHLIKQLVEDEVLAQQLVEFQITYSTIGRGHHACSTVGRGPTTCSTTGRGYRTCSTIGRGSYSLTGRSLFSCSTVGLIFGYIVYNKITRLFCITYMCV